MLINDKIFNGLCQSYQEKIVELQELFNNASSNKEKRELLFNFSNNYLMVKDLWDLLFKLYNDELYSVIGKRDQENEILILNEVNSLKQKSLSNFYFNKISLPKLLHQNVEPFGPQPKFLINEDEINQKFSFPNKNLESLLDYFQKFSSKPLSKNIIQQYQKMKEKYTEILATENDDSKWFTLITEIHDEVFVTNNIEYRISLNLNNISLWKLYLDYLENHNTKKMLEIYSRCCRYFIDDIVMKEKYKAAAMKYGPAVVQWKNPFSFEIYQLEDADENLHLKSITNNLWFFKKDTQACIATKYSSAGQKCQNFSFPYFLINYILESRNPIVIHKLHKSCKYFFQAYKFPVCHRFISHNSQFRDALFPDKAIQFYQQSLGIYIGPNCNIYCEDWYAALPKYKIYYELSLIISNSFYFDHVRLPNLLVQTMQHVLFCTAKHIEICNQEFTIKELKLLVGHGKVETIELEKCKIYKPDKVLMVLEEIIELLPRIVEFKITRPETTTNTNQIMSKLVFNNKIKRFVLEETNYENFEPFSLCEFIKNSFKTDAQISIKFTNTTCSRELAKATKDIVNNELEKHWQQSQKLDVTFYVSAIR